MPPIGGTAAPVFLYLQAVPVPSAAQPTPFPSRSLWSGFAVARQLSCASQTPSPSRSPVLSGGQVGPVPVQNSATSQPPAAARHCTAEVNTRSNGQLPLVPSQTSATSQTPAAGRQTVPPGTLTSDGHAPLVPVQVSATSQAPVAGRQTVP